MTIPVDRGNTETPINAPQIDCTFTKDALERFQHMPPADQSQFIIQLLAELTRNSQAMPQEVRDTCATNLIVALNTDESTDAKIAIAMWRTALFTALTTAELTGPSQNALIAALRKIPKEQALDVQANLATAANLGITTTSPRAYTAQILATFVTGAIAMASLANLRYAPNKKTAFALTLPMLSALIAGPSTTHRVTLAAATKLQTSYDKAKTWYQNTAETRAAIKAHVVKYQNYYIAGTVALGIGIGLLYLRNNSPALPQNGENRPSTEASLPKTPPVQSEILPVAEAPTLEAQSEIPPVAEAPASKAQNEILPTVAEPATTIEPLADNAPQSE